HTLISTLTVTLGIVHTPYSHTEHVDGSIILPIEKDELLFLLSVDNSGSDEAETSNWIHGRKIGDGDKRVGSVPKSNVWEIWKSIEDCYADIKSELTVKSGTLLT